MIYPDPQSLASVITAFKQASPPSGRLSGLCGFDGFIDTFIRMEAPDTMAEFGPKVAAAAGIAASYTVRHEGDKFGGNGPLFASGLHGLWGGNIDVTYIGAMGRDEVLPIYREALEAKTKRLVTLAEPAHSDCLEFRDGKIMLSDLRSCAEITLERSATPGSSPPSTGGNSPTLAKSGATSPPGSPRSAVPPKRFCFSWISPSSSTVRLPMSPASSPASPRSPASAAPS